MNEEAVAADHLDGSTAEATPDVIASAYCLATTAHAGQVDKAGVDYIEHPMAVAQAVKHLGSEHEVAAVLHDTVEDTHVTLDEIRERFGNRVADAVDALTRREGEKYPDFIRRAATNEIARAVKRADVTHNLSRPASLTPSLEERYIRALEHLDGHDAAAAAKDDS